MLLLDNKSLAPHSVDQNFFCCDIKTTEADFLWWRHVPLQSRISIAICMKHI